MTLEDELMWKLSHALEDTDNEALIVNLFEVIEEVANHANMDSLARFTKACADAQMEAL